MPHIAKPESSVSSLRESRSALCAGVGLEGHAGTLRALQANGFDVMRFGDSEQLVRYLEAAAAHESSLAWPRLILADLAGPNDSGFALLAELRRLDTGIPVIVIGCGADAAIDGELRLLGARCAVDASFTPADLVGIAGRLTGQVSGQAAGRWSRSRAAGGIREWLQGALEPLGVELAAEDQSSWRDESAVELMIEASLRRLTVTH